MRRDRRAGARARRDVDDLRLSRAPLAAAEDGLFPKQFAGDASSVPITGMLALNFQQTGGVVTLFPTSSSSRH